MLSLDTQFWAFLNFVPLIQQQWLYTNIIEMTEQYAFLIFNYTYIQILVLSLNVQSSFKQNWIIYSTCISGCSDTSSYRIYTRSSISTIKM